MQKLNFRFLFAAALAAALLSGCAAMSPPEPDKAETFSLSALKEEPALMERLGKALSDGGAAVIEIRQGETIPIYVFVDLPFAQIKETRLDLTCPKTAYIYISSEKALVSPDKQSWTPIEDLAGVKAAFGMGPGRMSFGFSATRERGAFMQFSLSSESR